MRRPLINYIRQQGGRLPRAVARQPAEDPLRHHPPTWGGHPPGPGTAARFGVDEGRDRHPLTMPYAGPLPRGGGAVAWLRGPDPSDRRDGIGPRPSHAVPLPPLRGDAARVDHPLRGPQPDRGWLGDQRELLPPRLPGQRGSAERRPRRRADGDRQRLLPLAGVATGRLREGRSEATVPAVRRDRRDRDDPERPTQRHLRPPEPESDPARSRSRPRLTSDPVARPTEARVQRSLTMTVVRGLIVFPATEIGVEACRPDGELAAAIRGCGPVAGAAGRNGPQTGARSLPNQTAAPTGQPGRLPPHRRSDRPRTIRPGLPTGCSGR